jgi:glutamate synthase domain-containing protein 2
MTTRYHIPTRPAPAPFDYPARFRLAEGDDYVKYGHAPFEQGRRGGDEHWTAQVITQTWYQAETGRIPISGAGYGGPFAGRGFDALWLDMSEIVRPTRDGIHGREYISTAVRIGRRLPALSFAASGALLSTLPPGIELPIPVIFDPVPQPLPGTGARLAFVRAAHSLGTLALVRPCDWLDDMDAYHSAVAPLLTAGDDLPAHRVRTAHLVEIEASGCRDMPAVQRLVERVRAINPAAVLVLRLPLSPDSAECAERAAAAGLDAVHLCADEVAYEQQAGDGGRPLVEALIDVHTRLVASGQRDRIAILAGGGIAAAEHVPKALVCGADAVAVDHALLVALGCALWADVRYPCPVEDREVDPAWGTQRIVNLMAAWRDQLLEVLGAMGMREVQRLRGELGRTILQRDEERAFRSLFGRVSTRHQVAISPEPGAGELEGDLRWPAELILATAEQARTARPPESGLEYRVGRSGGGFDRLRFHFEVATDEGQGARDALGSPIPNSPIPQFPTPQCTDPQSTNLPIFQSSNLSLDLNPADPTRPTIRLPQPWYGAGMSYGSISLQTMLARARAAQMCGSFTSTGEGGYPDQLLPYADQIITQVATGLFGVREDTIQRARIVEFKYAQGAKPGLGGHLLGSKVTPGVARMREAVQGTSLFSPFPFHSVYSVEDHKKHVDWIKTVNPRALISVKVSTPTDVDMVAVGSYFAGAHIIHLDGAYGGTGAAPEIAKKNIAMPLEYAIPKVHHFLQTEGIRDEVVVMASGGVRTAYDVAKAIALGADGCIVGTAELVAIGCMRLGTCERDRGCPFGIATTDPELAAQIDPAGAAIKIANLYASWRLQLAGILSRLGLGSIRELRGRTDLLVYLD